MEEVNDNHIKRHTEFFVFSCYRQKLFLIPVAELTLPEAHAVFRHHRRFSGQRHIILLDLGRRITCNHKIIDFFPGFRYPFRSIIRKHHLSDTRIVP